MLACIWGGDRFAWDSVQVLSLIAATVVLAGALLVRERRAADPIVPFGLLRTRAVAVASGALFLGTAALFAVNVFVPLFLQITTGASPTESGLLLVPAMLGITVSTTLSGRAIARTGRYKRFPILGLGPDDGRARAAGRAGGRPVARGHRHRARRVRPRLRHGHPGPGRGRAEQRRPPAARRGHGDDRLLPRARRRGGRRGPGRRVRRPGRRRRVERRAGVLRSDVIDAVQTVFLVAAPLAALALLVVLALPELPLQSKR